MKNLNNIFIIRKIFLILAIFQIILFNSCQHTITKDEARIKLEQAIKISISKNVDVINFDYSSSTGGDYTESFGIKFNQVEFNKILNKMRPNLYVVDSFIFSYEPRSNYVDKLITISFFVKEKAIYYTFTHE